MKSKRVKNNPVFPEFYNRLSFYKKALELGLKPAEYWECSLEDVAYFIEARLLAWEDGWKRTREITYTLYCANTPRDERISIYEFHPLPNDPTPEELAKVRADKRKGLLQRTQQRMKQLVEQGVVQPKK